MTKVPEPGAGLVDAAQTQADAELAPAESVATGATNSDPAIANPVTDDAFLGGELRILQPKRGYRAGIDAVLLAAAIDEKQPADGPLLDLGAGVGTIGLCAARRLGSLNVTLMEKQPELCDLARQNIERNDLAGRVTCLEAAIGASTAQIHSIGLRDNSFAYVVANPPFMGARQGTPSCERLKAASHAMDEAQNLNDWGRFMARMAQQGGTALMIHKAEALSEVLASFAGRFGSISVLPIYPRKGEPANRVIVRGIKGSRGSLVIHPGLVLHSQGNAFTPEIDAVLRLGQPLPVAKS